MPNLNPYEKMLRGSGRQYNKLADMHTWAQERVFVEQQCLRSAELTQWLRQGDGMTVTSLKQTVMQAAAMGLTFNPALQRLYIVPRRARRRADNESRDEWKRKVPVLATPYISYRGLEYLCIHEGVAKEFAAEIVYQADHFQPKGPFSKPEHIPTVDAKQRREVNAIGAYALVLTPDTWRFEFMDREQIQTVRNMSDNKGSLMWTKVWTEGWRKSPVRRISKHLMASSSSDRLAVAMASMDQHEGVLIHEEPEDTPVAAEAEEKPEVLTITHEQRDQLLEDMANAELQVKRFCLGFKIEKVEQLRADQYDSARARISAFADKKAARE